MPVVDAQDARGVREEDRRRRALSQFSSGAHAEVYGALRRLDRQGADAFVFDLRGNGGGLVDEAQLIASAFLPEGKIVTTRGRNVPEKTLDATGDPVIGKDTDVAVLVDRGTASASEIVAGALQDRDRATIVGTRTFGKGVFQEVIELSNGGALDITAGQYFTPSGRNLGGRGVSSGTGLKPDVRAPSGRSHEDGGRNEQRCAPRMNKDRRRLLLAEQAGWSAHKRRGRRGRTAGRVAPAATEAARRRAAGMQGSDPNASRTSILLERGRARFLVGERFFERGAPALPSAARRAKARPGRLALVRPGGEAASTVLRVLGEPHVARDVLDALMLERGLRRAFPAGVAQAARRGRRASRGGGRAAATCANLPTSSRSIRRPPRTSTTRSPPEDLGGGRTRVWVHIADVSAIVRPGDPVDREAYRRADERLRPRSGRADAARGALERGVLARPGRRPARRHGRAGARRRARR